jgi:uncharacterized lipoprotein NlpE involved in copper resistance
MRLRLAPVATAAAWLLLACTRPSPEMDAAGRPGSTADNITLVGRYAGTLPCADCSGIQTELVLYRRGPHGDPVRYELRETYLGTRDGDRGFTSRGEWRILRGSASDPDATVYQLVTDRPGEFSNWLWVSERELRKLDASQGDIRSTLNYTLRRTD